MKPKSDNRPQGWTFAAKEFKRLLGKRSASVQCGYVRQRLAVVHISMRASALYDPCSNDNPIKPEVIMFKSDFMNEWARLNPPSTQPSAGLGAAWKAAWRAYFAPLKMGCWLITRAVSGAL